MNPKRKPKNKNLNIDEQIEHLLDDDEYIIWSEQTQKHYARFASHQLRTEALTGGFGIMIIFAVLLFVIPMSWNFLPIISLLLVGLAFIAFPISNTLNRKNSRYVNFITNYQILVYDSVEQDVVYAFEHDNVQRFVVCEYGDNIGNITLDRRSDHKKKYRVTPTYPLQFALRGVNDLKKVTGLLRSQLGIEPEYLQIHQKPKQ